LKDAKLSLIANDVNIFITAFNEEINGQTDKMRQYIASHVKQGGLYSPEYAAVGRLFCDYIERHAEAESVLTLDKGFKG
jgi:hypothetical protein